MVINVEFTEEEFTELMHDIREKIKILELRRKKSDNRYIENKRIDLLASIRKKILEGKIN